MVVAMQKSPEFTDTVETAFFCSLCWQSWPAHRQLLTGMGREGGCSELTGCFFPHRSARSQGSCCCVRRSAVVLSTCSALGSPRCQRANSSAMSVPQVQQLLGGTGGLLQVYLVLALLQCACSRSSDIIGLVIDNDFVTDCSSH